MLSQTKLRIAARRNFDKSDVELVYGDLVRIIGGTYFTGGVAQGPANGLLDYRNFAADAGVPNSLKSNPSSIWLQSVRVDAFVGPGAASYFSALPPTLQDAQVTAWGVRAASVSSATNSGSFVLSYVRNGVSTQIATSGTLTNINPNITVGSGQVVFAVISGPALQAGDSLKLTITENVIFRDILAMVTVVSRHVR
jgi:hypothetical protein